MHTHRTINAARGLRQRHPDAPASACHVALVMAMYANPDGTSIRPGFDNLVRDTGLSLRTVVRAVSWLEDAGEIVRVKNARRGRAAVFQYVNGMS